MTRNSGKISPISVVIGILILLTVLTSFLFWKEMKTLNEAYSDMNQIEFLSSSTQRLISIAQSESFLQKDVFFIGDSTEKALMTETDNSNSVLVDPAMVILADDVLESWRQIESLLQQDPINNIDLGLARDAHFKSMTNLSSGISDYTKVLNKKISQYQGLVMVLFFAIAMVMLNNLLRTHTELQQSKALAQTAQIDTATGLYNRSRCQELFKSNPSPTTKKRPAILVLDLNDLKKTNDTLGHRVGDELIQVFANLLKEASGVHMVPPFIGRYGGDEFIIYYEDVENEEEIKIYLKELTFLTQNANDDENRFRISYAVGYCYVANHADEKLTIRQLFDKADEAMYENKVAGKKADNPNYNEDI